MEIAEFKSPVDFRTLREKTVVNATGYGARTLSATSRCYPFVVNWPALRRRTTCITDCLTKTSFSCRAAMASCLRSSATATITAMVTTRRCLIAQRPSMRCARSLGCSRSDNSFTDAYGTRPEIAPTGGGTGELRIRQFEFA